MGKLSEPIQAALIVRGPKELHQFDGIIEFGYTTKVIQTVCIYTHVTLTSARAEQSRAIYMEGKIVNTDFPSDFHQVRCIIMVSAPCVRSVIR